MNRRPQPDAGRPRYIGLWYIWVGVAIAIAMVWIFVMAPFFAEPSPVIPPEGGPLVGEEDIESPDTTTTAEENETSAAVNETTTPGPFLVP